MSNYKVQYKTFLRAYFVLHEDNRKYKRFYIDKRLPQAEKSILKAWFDLKKGLHKEALDRLLNLGNLSPFLNGMKSAAIGHCYNNTGQLDLAIEAFENSISELKEAKDTEYIFNPTTSLILVYSNLKDLESMHKLFPTLEALPLDTDRKKAIFLQCRACYKIEQNQEEEALKDIDECLTKYRKEIESRLPHFYTTKLITLFRLDRIDEFSDLLVEYKQLPGTRIKENYKYITLLMKYIYNNSPIYVYKRDFENAPYLFHELNVVKSLALYEEEEAKKSWSFLQSVNPQTFLDDFQYLGGKSLFSTAFNKAFKGENSPHKKFCEDEFDAIRSTQDKILYILECSQKGISKEELIQLLWNEEPNEVNLARLTTQVSRLRRKTDQKIVTKSGKYKLKKAA